MSINEYSITDKIIENVADTGELKDTEKLYKYDLVDTLEYKVTLPELITQRDRIQAELDNINIIITEIGKL